MSKEKIISNIKPDILPLLVLAKELLNLEELQDLENKSPIEIWKDMAEKQGYLVAIRMHEEVSGTIEGDKIVFYTNGLHGCVVYLEINGNNYSFGHVPTDFAAKRLDERNSIANNPGGLLLMPDIPEFNEISGTNVLSTL